MPGEAPDLPDDWQERMVDMIRGAAPLDGAWFAGGPVLGPADQIGVYRDQYRLRLYDALVVEVPGLCRLLGDEAEPLLRRYLEAHPSTSWTLNRVADRLADWLAAQPDVPAAQVEMARLDRAVQAGFEAAPGVPLDPARLASMPSLRLQPHVTLLRLRYDVHRLRASSGEPPPLREGDFPLVVFRRGIKMRHWEVPLGAWGILDGVGRGQPVSEALEQTFARGWIDPERLAGDVQRWFRDFAERGLVQVAE